MNEDVFAGQWKQMRGELKSWWGKLADNDCDRIGGQKDKLVGVVQEKYGYAREQAQQEVDRRLEEYSDTMSGPNGSRKRGAAEAVVGAPANAPHEGPIATTVAAVASGLESVEGAISTGLETAQDAVSTAASAVAGGLETAQDAVSTAASAVAGGLETAQGVVSTAATAVADGLGSASSYLQEKEFAEMATDLTALIRRYPVQSLLVGVGLGYVLARLTTR
jgi:uncharacterized protein YjbJ (UPF0337 family)